MLCLVPAEGGEDLDEAERLFREGRIQPTVQVYQAPNGITTTKTIYKIYYHYAYPLGRTVEVPSLIADSITDRNGHILPYVKFKGGRLQLDQSAIDVLRTLARR